MGTALYDLVNLDVIRTYHGAQLDMSLAMAVGDVFDWEAIRAEDWLYMAEDCGYDAEQLLSIMRRVTENVRAAFADFDEVLAEARIRPDEEAFIAAWRRSVEEGVERAQRWTEELARLIGKA